MLVRVLDRLFVKENFSDDCPGGGDYLHRWIIVRFRSGRGLYLHRFLRSDWTRDMHDHPKPFLSIGLCGGYVEGTPEGTCAYRAPWIRRFPPHHVHRVRINRRRGCWTLVYVGRREKAWGFWRAGKWVPWRRYHDKYLTECDKSTK